MGLNHTEDPQVLTPVISLLCILCSGETTCSLASELSLLNHGPRDYRQPGMAFLAALGRSLGPVQPSEMSDFQTLPGGAPPPARDRGMGAEEAGRAQMEGQTDPEEGRKERGPSKGFREAGESLPYTHEEASKGCLTQESPLGSRSWLKQGQGSQAASKGAQAGCEPQGRCTAPGSKAPLRPSCRALSETAVAAPSKPQASPGPLTPGCTPDLP